MPGGQPVGSNVLISVTKTRPSNTTAYGAGDVISEDAASGTAWTFSNAAKVKGGSGTIVRAVILDDDTGRTQTGGGAADPSAIGHHGHTLLFRDVLKAIRNGTNPSIDGNEGRRSVEIILAIYKSAETGRTIQLPLARDPVLRVRKTGVATRG